MTDATQRYPENKSLQQSNRFLLSFGRLPYVTFNCQLVNLPGISIGEYAQENPFVPIWRAGDKAMYEPLVINFMIDEELWAWQAIHDWMRGLSFPTSFDEYKNLSLQVRNSPLSSKPQYSDATLTLLTGHQNPYLRVKFYDVFPTSLSQLQFNVQDTAQLTLIADATFRYTYFDLERISS